MLIFVYKQLFKYRDRFENFFNGKNTPTPIIQAPERRLISTLRNGNEINDLLQGVLSINFINNQSFSIFSDTFRRCA